MMCIALLSSIYCRTFTHYANRTCPPIAGMSSVSECGTIPELQTYLTSKTRELRIGCALIGKFPDGAPGNDEDRELMKGICTDLGKIQKQVASLREARDKLLHDLECDKVTLQHLDTLKKQIQEQNDNVPKFMPKPQMETTPKPVEEPAVSPERQKSVKFERDSVGPGESKIGRPVRTGIPRSSGSSSKPSKKQKLAKKTEVPNIDFLTTEEYKTLPKYMLGRLKYEQINSLVEELNSVTIKKYKIIDTPMNKLGSEGMQRFARMTDTPATKETLNHVWFEARDIKDFASTALVVNLFTKVLPILRHCHRLKQIRAGKIEKYIVL